MMRTAKRRAFFSQIESYPDCRGNVNGESRRPDLPPGRLAAEGVNL
jgi:hypothetical protein